MANETDNNKAATENKVDSGAPSTGDVYDEDTGEYLTSIENMELVGLPAQLGILYQGYWYVFTPTKRYRDQPPVQDPAVVEELTTTSLLERAGELKPVSADAPETISPEDSVLP